ncbi:nuclear transport factor 2 family protein [Amycolatopsis sp. EV170708-02-1]|uniref:nuclear transport factor 2 family protein n=1 Tax=Amycolatopsis sp. EV170708-02-1 TaxID=2919322 RepID=UPI001F0BDBF4|nr:nuclear transport factor 2 family protein [Amycolatopsis sp. EV170708-02-1]UMP07057.1 nuclear transport factor 2 family protein [Amycolatopsis sp. EV170708-02-1]
MSLLRKIFTRKGSDPVTSLGSDPVVGFLDTLGRGNVEAAMSLVDTDVRVTVYGLGKSGGSADVLREVLDDLVRAFPDLLITTKRVLRTGKVVTAELKVEGTQGADYAGAINQEKHLDLDEAWRFAVADGRIVAVDAYWCQQQLYRRLGVKRFDQIAIV